MTRTWCVALIPALFPLILSAQESKPEPNPVAASVRELLQRGSQRLVAAAEEMPADKYSFHPTPQQVTFGHLILHIAQSNSFLCSKISDTQAPQESKLSDTDSKEKLVSALKSSFDYCSSALAKVDDSKLGDTLTLFGGRKASRAAAMIAVTNDWADHYGTAAMYLRLNGLLPPTAQPRN